MFVCASGENFSFAQKIGVGLVDSAIELTKIILNDNPKSLIFIGSAGSYSPKIKIFDIFTSHKAAQIELSFIDSHSYTPIFNQIENVSHEAMQNTSQKIDDIVVNSSNYITTNENLAHKMASANILLENMEFFSVLRVAQYFNIPSLGIFCVTNYCNARAHDDFIKNHPRAMQNLESYIREHYEKYI